MTTNTKDGQKSEEQFMLTVAERNEAEDQFYELNYVYPHLVDIGQEFVGYMQKSMYISSEVNLVALQALIVGWIYAQNWFHNMSDQLPHNDLEIFEVVNDSALQAATDATIKDPHFHTQEDIDLQTEKINAIASELNPS